MDIQMKVKRILTNNYQLWMYFALDKVHMDKILRISGENAKIKQQVKLMWRNLFSITENKRKWRFYFIWFTLFLLNKKIKQSYLVGFEGKLINENDIFVQDLKIEKNNDDDLSVKSIELDEQDNLIIPIDYKSQLVFDKFTSILQVSSDQKGTVSGASLGTNLLFGY